MKYILEAAIKVAADLHAGVLDKNGQPYILHVLSGLYSSVLTENAEDDEEVLVARAAFVLHDTIEDVEGINENALYTRLMFEYIRLASGLDKKSIDLTPENDSILHRIVGVVSTVSKRDEEKGYKGYMRFIERIKDDDDPVSERVKRADIDSNTDPDRLEHLPAKEREYLEDKYEEALKILDRS